MTPILTTTALAHVALHVEQIKHLALLIERGLGDPRRLHLQVAAVMTAIAQLEHDGWELRPLDERFEQIRAMTAMRQDRTRKQ